MARRKEVSASSARCASERRLVWRHTLHRLQITKHDSPATSHISMLLGRLDSAGYASARSDSECPGGSSSTSYDAAALGTGRSEVLARTTLFLSTSEKR
ncbi:hypothetical protein ACEQUB_01410 [Ralstonia syzygii]